MEAQIGGYCLERDEENLGQSFEEFPMFNT